VSGLAFRSEIPTVKSVDPAGEDAVTLTLENGEHVTVHAIKGTCILPDGHLLTDCYTMDGPAYFLPSPTLIWEVVARLGLNSDDAEVRQFNHYLLSLESIVEASWADGVMTLVYLGKSGTRYSCQFAGEVVVNFIDTADLPRDQFTRYPLRLAIQEGQGEGMKSVGFRVDHTPEGYAALIALGWNRPLPALEARR